MAYLIHSGRLIDAILVFTLLEWLVLRTAYRRTGRGVAPADMWRNLLSGAFLLLALRIALVGGWWGWIAACLAASLIAHLADLGRLWRT